MAITFTIALPDPPAAHGQDQSFCFHAHGPSAFAEQFQQALRDPAWFARWRAQQTHPDDIDPTLGLFDPSAQVQGYEQDTQIILSTVTSLPGKVIQHRLWLLAGHGWQLRDVF